MIFIQSKFCRHINKYKTFSIQFILSFFFSGRVFFTNLWLLGVYLVGKWTFLLWVRQLYRTPNNQKWYKLLSHKINLTETLKPSGFLQSAEELFRWIKKTFKNAKLPGYEGYLVSPSAAEWSASTHGEPVKG
jgi:hypothetical protein